MTLENFREGSPLSPPGTQVSRLFHQQNSAGGLQAAFPTCWRHLAVDHKFSVLLSLLTSDWSSCGGLSFSTRPIRSGVPGPFPGPLRHLLGTRPGLCGTPASFQSGAPVQPTQKLPEPPSICPTSGNGSINQLGPHLPRPSPPWAPSLAGLPPPTLCLSDTLAPSAPYSGPQPAIGPTLPF